jgi:hypothetical protein
MCFEQEQTACHRGTFGKWWRENTGDPIAEFGTTVVA